MSIQEVIFTGFLFGIMVTQYPREAIVYLGESIREAIQMVRHRK